MRGVKRSGGLLLAGHRLRSEHRFLSFIRPLRFGLALSPQPESIKTLLALGVVEAVEGIELFAESRVSAFTPAGKGMDNSHEGQFGGDQVGNELVAFDGWVNVVDQVESAGNASFTDLLVHVAHVGEWRARRISRIKNCPIHRLEDPQRTDVILFGCNVLSVRERHIPHGIVCLGQQVVEARVLVVDVPSLLEKP